MKQGCGVGRGKLGTPAFEYEAKTRPLIGHCYVIVAASRKSNVFMSGLTPTQYDGINTESAHPSGSLRWSYNTYPHSLRTTATKSTPLIVRCVTNPANDIPVGVAVAILCDRTIYAAIQPFNAQINNCVCLLPVDCVTFLERSTSRTITWMDFVKLVGVKPLLAQRARRWRLYWISRSASSRQIPASL